MRNRIFCVMAIMFISFFTWLYSVESLVIIELKTNANKNKLEKLKLNLAMRTNDILVCAIENTEILDQNQVKYRLLTGDMEQEPIYLISTKKPFKLNYPLSKTDVLYQDDQLILARNSKIDAVEFAKYNLKVVQLEKTNQVYKNITTSYHKDISSDRIYDPLVINAINADSIAYFIQQLQNFQTRYAFHPNRFAVANWIKSQFIRMGYTMVVTDSFFQTQYQVWQTNVVAILPGTELPDQYVVIGGHHDSIVNTGYEQSMLTAPGADDNASGCAAVLETARVMKLLNYQPKTSIRFCTYAMEEEGLWGGKWDASVSSMNNMKIRAQINNDMIANQNSDNWRAHLQTYYGAEFLGEIGSDILTELTGVTPIVENNNTAGSDSWAYWANGYPSIFLAEVEFSPVYHTPGDLIGILNFPYARKMVQLAAAMTMEVSSLPSEPESFQVIDSGTGNSLVVCWDQIPDIGAVQYHIEVLNTQTQQMQSFVTSQTNYIVTGLTENVEYEISLYSSINNQNSIKQIRIGTPLHIPRQIYDVVLIPTSSAISLYWHSNFEQDISQFKVYRKLNENDTFQLYQTIPVTVDSLIDVNVVSNQWYYYTVTAVDIDQNESEQSIVLSGRKLSFDQGLLVIDDTYNGNGSLLTPTDTQVDEFYSSLLTGFQNSNFEIDNNTTITLSHLAPFSTVLYHRNTTNNTNILQNIEVFKEYLNLGGKLIISSYKPSQIFDFNVGYPQTFQEDRFVYDYLKIQSSSFISTARFQMAVPTMSSFPIVEVDTTKIHPSFHNRLASIESIVPNNEGYSVYQYGSGVASSDPIGSMNDTPVAVLYNGNDFKTFTMSFPLYYMKEVEAKELLKKVLVAFGETSSNEDNTNLSLRNTACLLSNYPNPFNPETRINYYLPQSEKVKIAIYNIKGQQVALFDEGTKIKGLHQLVWAGKDSENKTVSSGIYFYTLITNNRVIDSKKMILIK